MKRHYLRLGFSILILFIGVLVIVFKFRLGAAAEVAEHSFSNKSKGSQFSGSSDTVRSRGADDLLKPVDSRLSPLFHEDNYKLRLSDLADYLAATSRDPKSLTAAYLLTGDAGLFDELKLLRDSPDAMICVAVHSSNVKERLEYAKRFLELKPNDMTGYLLVANEMKDAGATSDQWLPMIEQGMRAELFSGGIENTMVTLREALASTGMSKEKGEIYLMTNDLTSMEILGDCKNAIANGVKASMDSAQSPETKLKTAAEYLQYTELFKEMSPYVGTKADFESMGLSVAILRDLPGASPVLEDGTTVSQLLQRTAADRKKLALFKQQAYEKLRVSQPSVVDKFLEYKSTMGLRAAEEWLISN